MGLYVKDEDVRIRLIGKVRFTEDDNEENKMHILLLRRLINEAEGQVEHDLSPRYATPFQTDAAEPFKKLPLRPTQEILRTLCELQSVIRVLETDFGRGSAVNGDEYAGKLRERYKEILDKLLARKDESKHEGAQGWMYPPLLGLRLNYFNTEADDGYAGMVLSTSQGDGSYPQTRINDPSETWWNAKQDDIES